MPIQIKRHLIILVILVAVFIIIRQIMVPETFGDNGHYRANSLIDNANKNIVFAGQEICIECHEDIGVLKEMDLHSNLSCELCHGPGMAHIENMDSVKMILPEGRNFCGNCHQQHAARNNDAIIQIDLKEHNTEYNCTHCHNPHAPWELRNQDPQEENL